MQIVARTGPGLEMIFHHKQFKLMTDAKLAFKNGPVWIFNFLHHALILEKNMVRKIKLRNQGWHLSKAIPIAFGFQYIFSRNLMSAFNLLSYFYNIFLHCRMSKHNILNLKILTELYQGIGNMIGCREVVNAPQERHYYTV